MARNRASAIAASGPVIDALADRCPAWAWIVPPLLLALVVFGLSLDVFRWDEWVIWGELLHKLENGTFHLVDLAAQQNEQRNLAARLFGLMLMPLFKLNRFPEYGLNILIAGVGFLAAVRLYVHHGPARTKRLAWLLFSMFSFSILQWETFTLGANSSVAVLPAALWAGLLIATTGNLSLFRLLAVGAVGILPSFSFANGLFYWLAVLPVLVSRARRRGNATAVVVIWAIMTAGAWTLYFLDFASPGQHPSLLSGLAHPFEFASYFFAYLGGGVSSDKNLFPVAILLGLASLPLTAGLALREWRAGGDRRECMLPWLGAILFTLCSAGVTTVARCAFGVEQALESRYASFSSPYWIALIGLFLQSRSHGRDRKADRLLPATSLTLAVSLAVFLLSTVLSTVVVYNRHDRFARARNALYALTDERPLLTIFPDTAYLMMQLPVLMQNRLSIYRNLKPLADYGHTAGTAGSFVIEGTAQAAEGRIPGLRLEGRLEDGHRSVLLEAGGIVVGWLPDTGAEWEIFVPLANLPKGEARLRAYALDRGENTLTPLAPEAGFPVAVGALPPVAYDIGRYFFIH